MMMNLIIVYTELYIFAGHILWFHVLYFVIPYTKFVLIKVYRLYVVLQIIMVAAAVSANVSQNSDGKSNSNNNNKIENKNYNNNNKNNSNDNINTNPTTKLKEPRKLKGHVINTYRRQ